MNRKTWFYDPLTYLWIFIYTRMLTRATNDECRIQLSYIDCLQYYSQDTRMMNT